MGEKIEILDVVALLEDLPERGLFRGQVGTVVDSYGTEAFEVEFSDNEGRTYAVLSLNAGQLMILHHEPIEVA